MKKIQQPQGMKNKKILITYYRSFWDNFNIDLYNQIVNAKSI